MLASTHPLWRQHGVATLAQLVEHGVPRATVGLWARDGRLHRLHRGVYSATPPALLGREAHYMAAVLAAGPGAVLSHTSAARLLGLDRTRRVGTIHVSVPRDNHRAPRGILVHRATIAAEDTTRRFGIPTTTATRTLIDQAASLSPTELRSQFEQAEYLELLDRPRLASLLVIHSRRKGTGNLRRLAGFRPLPLSRVRSKLERIILTTCRTHSLPLPEVNVPLFDYEVDFFWPEAQLVIEADGGHHRGAQRAKDNARDLVLQRAGKLVRRYSEEALADEAAVAREIQSLLLERLP